MLLEACGGIGGTHPTLSPVVAPSPTPSTLGVTGPSPTASAQGTKTALRGLMDMGDITFHNTDAGIPVNDPQTDLKNAPGIFGAIVLNFTWNELQNTLDGPINTSVINAALAQVQQYNALYPSAPLGVKFRIWPGPNAPAFAKALDGGPITLTRNHQTGTITVAHWWMPDYIAAWQNFQGQLAAAYDSNPLVHEISITSCSAQTDEPFVGSADPSPLLAAGYTDVLQEQCLSNAYLDYQAWKYTRLDFTFNPFIHTDGTTPAADTAFTEQVMTAFRSAIGVRSILMNHSLTQNYNQPTDSNFAIYQKIAALGPEIEFQTQSPGAAGFDWNGTVVAGVALKATALEIWPNVNNGFESLPASQLQGYAQQILANSTP
jgi:hypothetical protein